MESYSGLGYFDTIEWVAVPEKTVPSASVRSTTASTLCDIPYLQVVHPWMTRRNKPSAADIEAQTDDEGVPYSLSRTLSSSISTKGIRQHAAHEMRVLRSGSEGEPPGGAASGDNAWDNVLAGEVDHETQPEHEPGSSTRSQAQSPKDSPLNTGERFTISYFPSDSGF
jgi:hypothetical protein